MSDAHDPKDVHGAGHSHLFVFGSLLVLTGFTVAAYFLHLPMRAAITPALLTATAKGTLVAAWFIPTLTVLDGVRLR